MTQPDWTKAPEGATHCRSVDGHVEWYKQHENGGWYRLPKLSQSWLPCEMDEWGWLNSVTVPRPTQQWKGPQDGLPPVGTVCRLADREHQEGVVVAHLHTVGRPWLAAVQMDKEYAIREASRLLPLVSERDHFTETMLTHMDPPMFGIHDLRIDLGKLFDRGVRLRGGV